MTTTGAIGLRFVNTTTNENALITALINENVAFSILIGRIFASLFAFSSLS